MTNKTKKYLWPIVIFNLAVVVAFHLLPAAKNNADVPGIETQPNHGNGLIVLPPGKINHQIAVNNIRPGETPDREADSSPGNRAQMANLPPPQGMDELRDWARSHPEAAFLWAEAESDSPERHETLSIACFEIAQTNPAEALFQAEKFHLTESAVVENLVQQWAGKDFVAAQNWVEAQPAGAQRDALTARVALVWSQSAPAEAVRFVLREIPDGPDQDEAVIMALHQWSISDFYAANSWAQQIPGSSMRDRALRELSGMAFYQVNAPQ